MKSVEGNMEGTVNESQGNFTGVPISEIVFEDANLSFEFSSPTPPDGLQTLVKAEFKVGVDTMDGMLSAPDLGASATATAIREKL